MFHYRADLHIPGPTFQSLAHLESKPAPRPSLMARIIATLWRWHRRNAARRALAEIDARSLRDIGIAPELVEFEMRQPFWRDLRDWRA